MTQDDAFDLMVAGYNVFLTGMAGTGKSFLLNQFIDYCYDNNITVATTASTGIAATHIDGNTIHSWAGFNIYDDDQNPLMPSAMTTICNKAHRIDQIRETQVLIIDEISMMHGHQLDWVHEICSRIRENPLPFGGIQVIVTGDFLQLPPVQTTKGKRVTYAFDTTSWCNGDFKICYLTEIKRQADPDFIKLLNEVRYGQFTRPGYALLKNCVNRKLKIADPTEIYSKNENVDKVNTLKLSKIKKKEVNFTMSTTGPDNIVKQMINTCLSPYDLKLKIGAQVIFTRNNYQKGFRNGTFGTVLGFDKEEGHPIVELPNGDSIDVPLATWEREQWDIKKKAYKVIASITQYPLKLAYAITVHKSQGCTLDYAKIALSNLFIQNMGYVALSRIKSLDTLTLVSLDNSIYKTDPLLKRMDQEFKKLGM